LLDPEKLIKYTEIPPVDSEDDETEENKADTELTDEEAVTDGIIDEEIAGSMAEEAEKTEENILTEGEE